MMRKFQPKDLPAIEEIAREVVSQPDLFPFTETQGALDYWFSSGSNCYVYCENQEVLGTYVIKPNIPDRGSHVANAGYMVKKSAQGKGIGKKLVTHSFETAKSIGFLAMQFNIVVSTNQSAIDLWKKVGFQTIGTVPEAFRSTDDQLVDLHIMHRKL